MTVQLNFHDNSTKTPGDAGRNGKRDNLTGRTESARETKKNCKYLGRNGSHVTFSS